MAYITLDAKKLRENFEYLDAIFRKNDIKWSIVTKVLSGNRDYLREVLKLGIKQIFTSSSNPKEN